MQKPERFIELDIWRGMAIVGMIVFHFFFLLDYLKIQEVSYSEGAWLLLARLVQWSFLLLVGIGLHLSYQKSSLQKKTKTDFLLKSFRRGAIVFLCGFTITAGTLLVAPEAYVRFGILHLIGFSILALSFLADRPKASFWFAGAIYVLSFMVNSIMVDQEWLLVFGFRYPFQALDYFPVFPWMAIPALGISLGSLFYPSYQSKIPIAPTGMSSIFPRSLAFFGKHSLLIYMIHVPILIGIVAFFF